MRIAKPFTYLLPHSARSALRGESFFNEKCEAALFLPSIAHREDTLYCHLFKDHMIKYYRQWYTYAVTECHLDIKLSDLILVTGCNLTRQWEMSTDFRRDQGGPIALHNSSSAEWRATQPMSSTRQGPPQAPHLQTSPSENDNNQCIFICGFYIKDRSWSQDMKAASRRQIQGWRLMM